MAFWLAVFLAVAVTIQARQTAAIRSSRRVAQLRERRTALEAERAGLEREIRLRTGRRELGRVAEDDLGLHFPNDSEFTQLQLSRPRR
ncbi:MAG: hypothetical protein OEW17_09880 [Gemmatimonadota bacterium]|nr:hypothetical protein [Gemmatimonadota bacterium]MDH4349104.1 hypothetical protein [Gemmatimonadota bacterium]MDH5283955.1 hypothetical protein [Gemmatimonadota bacterium]